MCNLLIKNFKVNRNNQQTQAQLLENIKLK